jgi:hypothetical protein
LRFDWSNQRSPGGDPKRDFFRSLCSDNKKNEEWIEDLILIRLQQINK